MAHREGGCQLPNTVPYICWENKYLQWGRRELSAGIRGRNMVKENDDDFIRPEQNGCCERMDGGKMK